MPISESVRQAYSNCRLTGLSARLQEVVDGLANGTLTPEDVSRILGPQGASNSARPGLADIVLFYIETASSDRLLTREEVNNIRNLKILLRVDGQALLANCRERVKAFLNSATSKLLADESVDFDEAQYQTELQAAFDLGYDDFLELTRDAFDFTVDGWIAAVRSETTEVAERLATIERKITSLATVYPLTDVQRQALRMQ